MSEPAKHDLRSRLASSAPEELPSLGDLALMPPDELAKQDLALLNLRCAEGLPGAEELDVAKCLETLDRWAEKVRFETDRHLYRYAQSPEEYENSEAYFRMLTLITVLQQDFKVHYNPKRIREIDFKNSQDLFIHGMVNGGNGGTCVSMPVTYTAVARRLGYPVNLVAADSHVFCRWDSGNKRLNIEATSQGMNCYDDAYYMKWPKPISPAHVEQGWYLKSLDVSESFAMFLAVRGHCLEDNRFAAKARVAYAMAHEKIPQHPLYAGYLRNTLIPKGFLAGINRHRQRPFEPPQVYRGPGTSWRPPSAATAGIPQPRDVLRPPLPSTADSFSPQPSTDPGLPGSGVQL